MDMTKTTDMVLNVFPNMYQGTTKEMEIARYSLSFYKRSAEGCLETCLYFV